MPGVGLLRPFVRELARRPAFGALATATLALGIGAPTAVFAVVQAVLVRPLPYPEPERLVQFRFEGRDEHGPVVFDALPVSMAIDWSRAGTTLADLALVNDRAAVIAEL